MADIQKLNVNNTTYDISTTWSKVTGKPSTFPSESHTHDDRYYTESEVDTKLSGKSNTGHTHSNYVTIDTDQTITGTKTFNNGDQSPITLTRSSSDFVSVRFDGSSGVLGYLGFMGVDQPMYRRVSDNTYLSLLHSGNSSVSGGGGSWGASLSVTMNGSTRTLTIPNNPNTWRPITDSYSGTTTTTSLSQKGANDLYNALVNGYATSAGNADTVDNKHASDFAPASHTHSGYASFSSEIFNGDFKHIGYSYYRNIEHTGPVIAFGASASYYAQMAAEGGFLYFRQWYEDHWLNSGWKEIAFTSSNVASATKLKTARTITLTGSVTGSGSFDGSDNLNITTTTNHTHSYLPLSGGTMTGNITFNAGQIGVYSGSNGILAEVNSSNTWTGVNSYACTVVGSATTPTVIRTNSDNLYHYNGTDRYKIYTSANLSKSTLGLGNVQNTAFYARQATVNGTTWNLAGTTNSATTFTIYAPTTAGTSGQFLTSTGGTPSWTSISYYGADVSRTANTVLAAPNGSNGVASFRKLVAADLPSHTHSYLPLTGGTMSGVITLKSGGSSAFSKTALSFTSSNGATEHARIGTDSAGGLGLYSIGGIYIRPNNTLGSSSTNGLVITNTAFTYNGTAISLAGHTHSYLPLSGGSLTGSLSITTSSSPLALNRTSGNPVISYQSNGALVGVLGFDPSGVCIIRPQCQSNSNYYNIIHTGNIGSQSVNYANSAGSSSSCTGNAATATAMSSFDVASSANVNRYVWMSWSDNSGKPSYHSNLTFNTSTNTLTTVKVKASSGFYQDSDERLKTFYDPIKPDLEKLKKLRKNYFKFNDKYKLEIGVSAQEIQNLYPEIVSTDDDGYLSVAYDKLSVIALAAIDELDNKYEKEINDLKDQLNAIKNILNEKGIN